MRDIIIVKNVMTTDGCLSGGAVLWLTTPATLVPYAVAPGTIVASHAPDITPAEQAALNAGTITEMYLEAGKFRPGATDAEIQQTATQWLAYEQAQLNATAPPKRYAGASHDSTTGWTNWPT